MASGRVDPRHPARVGGDQPPADMQRGGPQDAAILAQRQLGRAAADIDVQDTRARIVAGLRRARPIGGQHRLHVVARGGGNEIAALFRDDMGNRLRILAPQRLAGQDHYAGVDVARAHRCLGVGRVDDRAQRFSVNGGLVGVRGKADR